MRGIAIEAQALGQSLLSYFSLPLRESFFMRYFVIFLSALMLVVGAIWHLLPGLLTWFGHLPGDLEIETDAGVVQLPLVSILVWATLITWLLSW